MAMKLVIFIVSFLFASSNYTNSQAETLLEKIESPYNTIFVYKQPPYITLAFGHKRFRYVESRRNPKDLTELPIEYTRAFTIGLAYPPKLNSFLMIGMGGGSTSWYIHKSIPKAHMIAVELDKEIVRLAEKYYQLKEGKNFSISQIDGRIHILRNKQRHDIIFIDAYRGPFVPFHLMTKEFFTLAKQRLNKGGVLVQNIEPSTMLFDAAIVTMRTIFDHVDLYKAGGNIVAIAYDGTPKNKTDLINQAKQRQQTYKFRYPLPELIDELAMPFKFNKEAKPLTDDFAPVNTLKEIKSHNRKWNERGSR